VASTDVTDAEANDRFRVVFEEELDYVWTSLRRLGVDSRDLEDVAQEVFVAVHRHWQEYDPVRPVRPWLFAFAARCASDWRRLARHRVEVVAVAPDERATGAPGADEVLESTRDRQLVVAALAQIDGERRAVFILHDLDECPMKEVTRVLGIPLFTGYSRLRVARQEFTAAVRSLRGNDGSGGRR
jgi:RNA polymerase sigma-70 factor (ECF subfamily)